MIERELKGIHIYGCRCNERLKVKTEGSKHLGNTGLCGGRGHVKIETRIKLEDQKSLHKLGGTECTRRHPVFRGRFCVYYNRKNETYREDIYMCVGVMRD